MRPGLGYRLLLLAIILIGTGQARAQQWSSEPSHYSRGVPTPEPSAPFNHAPAVHPPMPFRLVSAAEPLPVASPTDAGTLRRVPLKLAPREKSATDALERPTTATPLSAVSSVAGSLAAVLGLFFVVVWCTRRLSPAGASVLPKEVVELLGRAPLNPRQQMQLVRLGNKLVLLSVTATGAAALAEVTDAAEVERLSALCRRQQSGSSTAAFNTLLSQIGSEPAAAGFVGEARRAEATPTAARRR